MVQEEYFKYSYHGFTIYEELYGFKETKNFIAIYELTWLSVASLRDIINFYNNEEEFNLFKDLRRVK